jgi:glycosyltransferase involved in cell wall biosynthesis
MSEREYTGRLAVQQRVLPVYRGEFFDMLAETCRGGLSVFAGQSQRDEQIASNFQLGVAKTVTARNLHLFGVSSPFYQCWQVGILEWLEAWQPDALIVEANPRYLSTPQAIRWMHAHSRPVIGWGLGAPPKSGTLSVWRNSRRLSFLKSLDAIIAYSQRGANEYRRLDLPAGRIFVAPNAASARPVALPPSKPGEFMHQPVVLYVGRLQERKRIDNLLRACAALPQSSQPRCWIVGDGPARQSLEALVTQVYPQAEFYGAKYGAELDSYFNGADVFILPGTGGLAVQQAMSHGLPVIVAEGDGTQADLVRPDNGWLVPAGDLPALISALSSALSNVPRLRRMGLESYRIVSQEHNLEAMVDAFLDVLNTLKVG